VAERFDLTAMLRGAEVSMLVLVALPLAILILTVGVYLMSAGRGDER